VRAVEHLRTSLGDTAFEVASAEGQALPPGQVVAEVVLQLGVPPSDPVPVHRGVTRPQALVPFQGPEYRD